MLSSLSIDDKAALTEATEVEESVEVRTLRTIGDKWSYLQRMKFGANAQPFYVILDNDGNPLAGSRSYNEDIQEYISFLRGGISNYNDR